MVEPLDTYKRFRNRVANLSFEESFAAAWAFSQFVQIRDFNFPRDVERHSSFTQDGLAQPYAWQLETILREVVLSASLANRRGKSLKRWDDLADVVNHLRALEGVLHQLHLSGDNILLEMLRVSHQQFPWQRRPKTRFVGRYYRVFSDADIDAICTRLTKLSVQKIYAIGSALWGHFSSRAFLSLPVPITIANISKDDLDAFFALASTGVYALRQQVKADFAVDDTFAYDNRFLRASPLISFQNAGKEFLACPLPTLLFWRFTSGLYYDLTRDNDFFNALGASFQKYVGEVLGRALKDTKMQYLPEEKYGKKGYTKDTVDWVLLDEEAAVFIECKSKRLSLGAKANLVSRDALLTDIGKLADGVVQLYKTVLEYKADKYPSLRFNETRIIVPLVVTLENWFPLQHAVLIELDKQVEAKLAAQKLPDSLRSEMPYVIASCDEIEEAAQIIGKVGVKVFFEGRRQDKYKGWMLEGYMADAFNSEHRAAIDLFSETYDEILQPFR